MHQPLRIGIAGIRHPSAELYAAALASLDGAALAGVWDADTERARMFAARHGSGAHADLGALLPNIDALIVAAPAGARPEIVDRAMRAGVAVLCEPPLALTLAAAQNAADTSAQLPARLSIAFPLRYHHAMQQLRQAIQHGALGELLFIRLAGQGAYRPAEHHSTLLERAVPLADLLLWLTGRAPRQAYAEIANIHGGPAGDAALVQIMLDGGLHASLDPSWSRPPGYPADGDLTIEATGTSGVAHVDAFAQHVEHIGAGPHAGRRAWGDDLHRLMLADWLGSLRGGQPAPIAAADGLRALELVFAARRSAELGIVIEL